MQKKVENKTASVSSQKVRTNFFNKAVIFELFFKNVKIIPDLHICD